MTSYWCWEKDQNGVLISAEDFLEARKIFMDMFDIPSKTPIWVQDSEITVLFKEDECQPE